MKIRTTIRLLTVLTVVFAAQGMLHASGGTSASAAVPPLQRVVGPLSAVDSDPYKFVHANCPHGTRLVGGGAWVDDHGSGMVMLTRAEPALQNPNEGLLDHYDVTAQETTAYSDVWSVRAYAICAAGKGLPRNLGMHKTNTYPPTPGRFKADALRCPTPQRVVSTGTATIYTGIGLPVGVQLTRASGPLDIARSTARTAGGFAGAWTLTTTVICADPILGVQLVGEVVDAGYHSVTCPADTRVYGAGAGGSLTDSGEAFLRGLYISADLRTVSAAFTTPPTGGMAVQAICVPTP